MGQNRMPGSVVTSAVLEERPFQRVERELGCGIPGPPVQSLELWHSYMSDRKHWTWWTLNISYH